jgi:hypothetical protein
LLRPGNAGSNTAAEHIEMTGLALAQMPARLRRRVLIRADPAAAPTSSSPGSPGPAGAWPTRSA